MDGVKAIQLSQKIQRLHDERGVGAVRVRDGEVVESLEGVVPLGEEMVVRRRSLRASKDVRRMLFERKSDIDVNEDRVLIWSVYDAEQRVSRMGLVLEVV